jgi:hypothetical protein
MSAVLAFALSGGGGHGTSGASTPSSDASTSALTLQTACAEVAPDMAFRVDALRRAADRIRADIAVMKAQANDAGVARATTIAEALGRLADAENNQPGVSRATQQLGKTLASLC